ncbi:hypothetical protein HK097_007955 [Rhizophlyctis rosea]|uniref:Uncharacterized protein n=1 Tax=Rhizophlyctis rosea TaxID=64517 RepID=A0AAD5X1Y2_9FUNG|nr:hypothetical protein HK097_007955 [Rhizophlyctis rosea]
MLDTHPGLLNEIQKVSFGVALDGPVFELGPYIRALIPGTKLTMRAKTNEIILGLSVHLKSMSNLHTLRIQCADTGEFGLPTAAVFLQSLPPSIKTLTLGFFWAGVLHNIDIDIHICPILARACRNMEKVTITLRCLCPSFFESVDAFPNLKELYIMVDAGYWYTCKNVCTRMQWPEGWKEFERAGLQNRHKVPNLRVFAMWNDQDWESAVYNLVDGSVFMVSAAERRARETEDAARRGNPRPEGGVSHNEMAELMTRRYPPGGPQRVTWTGVTMD